MLHELSVRDFRCFSEARLRLDPEMTILIGANGRGKTSLIEAACVLLRLQSPRTASRSDFIRFGAKTCLIEGVWRQHRLRFAASRTTRRLAVDGAVCGKSAEYLASSGRLVWMDHSDMNLVRGGSEHRRRFLDFAASQIFPGYLRALRGYERALRSRNHLLKRDAVVNWRQADAYAQVMEDFARVIVPARIELTGWLHPIVSQAHAVLSGGERAAVEYLQGAPGAGLRATLSAMRSEEERTRTTAAGAHRDDLRLLLQDREAGAFASEGQQRTLALALKIAQAHVLEQATRQAPLLLIDDIFGELDRGRRQAVLNHLPGSSQKVITTTNLDWAADLRGRVLEVKAGGVLFDAG